MTWLDNVLWLCWLLTLVGRFIYDSLLSDYSGNVWSCLVVGWCGGYFNSFYFCLDSHSQSHLTPQTDIFQPKRTHDLSRLLKENRNKNISRWIQYYHYTLWWGRNLVVTPGVDWSIIYILKIIELRPSLVPSPAIRNIFIEIFLKISSKTSHQQQLLLEG